jgi:miniconductance mechanosensitive channel
MQWLSDLGAAISAQPLYPLVSGLVVLLGTAWLADRLTRRVLLRVAHRLVEASPVRWDDALIRHGVVRKLARAVPALVIVLGVPLVPDLPAGVATVLRNVAAAWVVVAVARGLSAMLSVLHDLYWERDPDRARARPIKGYLEVARIVLVVVAGVLVVATLVERSPVLLLSGLGAMAAVLMLVFKDTLLSLVASVQLSSNDMVRVGDWIEMPQLGADGDVVDIALHTVKVQNWDKTITTIPTYRLVSESFRNWRGMSESGGRRIKRAIHIDQGGIRYLEPDEREALHRFVLLRPYLEQKAAELAEWNGKHQGEAPVNLRRLTNIGSFRAYARAYLKAHPKLRQDMTLLVRQLPPGPQGLPIEIYCFTATTAWGEYEDIMSDIFDHLLAILPEFGLRAFQAPGGGDVVAAAQALAAQRSEWPGAK